MNFITEGGLPSKNSPLYSKNSFELANANNDISGIKVDAYLTVDNEIVLLNNNIQKYIGINNQYIHDHTFDKIKKINYGTKVKRSTICNLNELLHICINKKYLIINLQEAYKKNSLFVDRITQYVNSNANIEWFLMSNSSEIISLLCSKKINAKIGKIIKNHDDMNLSLDFYSIPIKNTKLISNISRNTIIINDLHTYEDFYLVDKYKKNFNNIFIITSNYNLIKKFNRIK